MIFLIRENNRLLARGIVPVEDDLKKHPGNSLSSRPWLTGRVAAQIREALPAKKIIEATVNDAARILKHDGSLVDPGAKL